MLSDFRRTIGLAREGDVVYCDPPYEPMPGRAGFTNYTPDGFKWEDQLGVVEACRAAHRRGAKIVISNSSAPAIDQLYRDAGFTIHHIPRRQSIASNGNSREITTDILGYLINGQKTPPHLERALSRVKAYVLRYPNGVEESDLYKVDSFSVLSKKRTTAAGGHYRIHQRSPCNSLR